MPNPYSAIVSVMDDEQLTSVLASGLGLDHVWDPEIESAWSNRLGDQFDPLSITSHVHKVLDGIPGMAMFGTKCMSIVLDGEEVYQVQYDSHICKRHLRIINKDKRRICEVAAMYFLSKGINV